MIMSSPTTSDYERMARRDSSSSTKRRPRLLRACVTEPSLTASNASRDALANPQSSRRATDLLSRVVFTGGSSPDSASQNPFYERMARTDELCSSPTSHSETMDDVHTRPHGSDRYFSFPRFDTWEVDGQEGKDGNLQAAG
ncbi:hypothetical protein RB597_000744 [Gaeumannomyces tritici]